MYDERSGALALLADAGRHARHLHPDALDRHGGDAEARRRLRRAVRRLEPRDLGLQLHARRRPARLPLQHGRLLEVGPEGRLPTRGGRRRSSGRSPRRRRSSTSTRFRASSAAPTSSASPARATRSWPAKRHRRRARAGRSRTAPAGATVSGAGAGRRWVNSRIGRTRRVDRRGRQTVLAFLNEVAGGRRLLETLRDRVERGAGRSPSSRPRTSPPPGRSSTWTRSAMPRQPRRGDPGPAARVRRSSPPAAVMDPIRRSRSTTPSAPSSRPRCCSPACPRPASGCLRRDLVSGRTQNVEAPITHIPVRIEDDADPLGRHPHARRRDADGRQPRAGRAASRTGRAEQAAPLHLHLPALRRPQPRRGVATASPERSPRSTAARSTPPVSR